MLNKTGKYCSMCLELKDYTEFYLRIRGDLDIYQSKCKLCEREDRRQRYKRFKERELYVSRLYKLRNGDRRTPEDLMKKYENERAKRLALRLARAELIITLTKQVFKIPELTNLGTRELFLTTQDDQCLQIDGNTYIATAVAVRTIRHRTVFCPDAVAGLLDCATSDVLESVKRCNQLLDYRQGNILVCDRYRKLIKKYEQEKHIKTTQVFEKDYGDYTAAQRAPRTKWDVKNFQAKEPPGNLNLDTLLDTLVWYYATTWSELVGDTRLKRPAMARQVGMYIMTKYLHMDQGEIGAFFGRDHATVSYGIKQGKDYMRVNHGSFYYELHKKSIVDKGT
jgi:Bacterial dnaA protein helix-turn-helix